MMTDILDGVRDYYGKRLKTNQDLKTNACKLANGPTLPHVRAALNLVHDKVVDKYYGCGMIIAQCVEGTRILDLGSGSGRDCYVLSKLVGQNGHVTGVDMTDEQLDVANRYIDYHTEKFGFRKPNVDFVKGYIEKLDECELQDNSFDIVVSNCVINLSHDKPAVLRGVHRLLKEGGELYFSDVYVDRDLPEEVRRDKVTWGEGIGGAIRFPDLIRLAEEIGFSRPRMMEVADFVIMDPVLREAAGDAKFAAVTCRLFKPPAAGEQAAEVMYDGSVRGCANELKLDNYHLFKTESFASVDGETATIIKSSRFADSFKMRPAKAGVVSKTEDIVDPFVYLEKFGNAGAVGSKCCGGPKEKSG